MTDVALRSPRPALNLVDVSHGVLARFSLHLAPSRRSVTLCTPSSRFNALTSAPRRFAATQRRVIGRIDRQPLPRRRRPRRAGARTGTDRASVPSSASASWPIAIRTCSTNGSSLAVAAPDCAGRGPHHDQRRDADDRQAADAPPRDDLRPRPCRSRPRRSRRPCPACRARRCGSARSTARRRG